VTGLDPDQARRLLSAYENPESVLVAEIIRNATGGQANAVADRRTIEEQWHNRVPSGHKAVRDKVRNALRILERAGIIQRTPQGATVVDPALLAMSAGNLRLMRDTDARRLLPRSQWAGLPDVPDELLEAQIDRVNGVRHGG
jgi:hypothetical protein